MSELPQTLVKLKNRLASELTGVGRIVISFAIGLLMAFFLDYLLYRIGLPSKPFIYVAF
jgi:hypothetical protein